MSLASPVRYAAATVLAAALVGAFALAARAQPDEGNRARGAVVFEANCVPCHGEDGKGDGPAAAALNPRPADFTDPARMGKVDEATRLKVVREGGAAAGLSPIMPGFQASLTDQQIHDVLAYIRAQFTH